jgi:hypothetical protein
LLQLLIQNGELLIERYEDIECAIRSGWLSRTR